MMNGLGQFMGQLLTPCWEPNRLLKTLTVGERTGERGKLFVIKRSAVEEICLGAQLPNSG